MGKTIEVPDNVDLWELWKLFESIENDENYPEPAQLMAVRMKIAVGDVLFDEEGNDLVWSDEHGGFVTKK